MTKALFTQEGNILVDSVGIICFRRLLGPTSVSAINTAEGKYF